MPKVISTYIGKGGISMKAYLSLPCTVVVHGNSVVVVVVTSEGLYDYLVGEEVLHVEGSTLGHVTEAQRPSKANRFLIRTKIYSISSFQLRDSVWERLMHINKIYKLPQ